MRQVLPVVGAIVGAYFGGAKGAQWGWAIGSVIGNAVDPLVIKGPSIGDLAEQTAQEGGPRPIFFGLSQPVAGNIVACSQPRIVTKTQSSGKGSGPKTTSQSVYRTYAIGIGEGPITQLVRCWRNGKLVYDSRPGGDASMNTKFLAATKIFLGSFDQLPSPDLEASFGAGNVPAMRGTVYIVRPNEDLTDQGGAVPQFVFQVLRCEGTYLTSRPYAVEMMDAQTGTGLPQKMHLATQPTIMDWMSADAEPRSMYVYGSEKSYAIPEDWMSIDGGPQLMNLFGGSESYAIPEDWMSIDGGPQLMNLFGGAQAYSIPEEWMSIDGVPISITLETV